MIFPPQFLEMCVLPVDKLNFQKSVLYLLKFLLKTVKHHGIAWCKQNNYSKILPLQLWTVKLLKVIWLKETSKRKLQLLWRRPKVKRNLQEQEKAVIILFVNIHCTKTLAGMFQITFDFRRFLLSCPCVHLKCCFFWFCLYWGFLIIEYNF